MSGADTIRGLCASCCVLFGLAAGGCSDLTFDADRPPSALAITPSDTLVTVGDTVRFDVTVLDQDGIPLRAPPAWAQPKWSAAKPEAIRMLGDGRGVALAPADTKVTAEAAGLIARTPLRVNPKRAALSVPVFYLTQGIQDRAGNVPLLAGRQALLRVFVTADQEAYFDLKVVATFFRPDGLRFPVPMWSDARQLPTGVDEGRLDLSFNGVVPAVMIVPGTTLAIEVDPEQTIELAPGTERRIPASGSAVLDILPVPTLDLTVVPVVSELDPDRRILDEVRGLNPDSEPLRLTRSILPVVRVGVSVHEPYATSVDLTRGPGWVRLLEELTLLYKSEGIHGYFYGALAASEQAAATGLGYIALESISAGILTSQVVAHELGHNMGLKHAPCGGAGAPDSGFPYRDGAVGVWGYDFHADRAVSPGLYKDVMGYCRPAWGSDYHFKRALAFRLVAEAPGDAHVGARARTESGPADRGPESRVLLLWGSTGGGLGGAPRLEPAFMTDGYASLPEGGGRYRLDGASAAGERLFSFGFEPTMDEFGGGHFVFAMPVEAAWEGLLDQVVLSGPNGGFTLSRGSNTPTALVTDPRTGRVRAILRDWTGEVPNWLGPDLEVAFSEGIPGPGSLR